MAKWTLPEGKRYTQADLDAAVAAALRQAADVLRRRDDIAPNEMDYYDRGWSRALKTAAPAILALLPDAGAALDRALAAQRERDAKVAEARADEKDSYGPDFDAGWEAAALVIAAAIRAQEDKT